MLQVAIHVLGQRNFDDLYNISVVVTTDMCGEITSMEERFYVLRHNREIAMSFHSFAKPYHFNSRLA